MKLISIIAMKIMLFISLTAIVIPDQRAEPSHKMIHRQINPGPASKRSVSDKPKLQSPYQNRNLKKFMTQRTPTHSRRAQEDYFEEPQVGEGEGPQTEQPQFFNDDYSDILDEFDKGDNPYGEQDVDQSEDDDGFNDPDGQPNKGIDGSVKKGIPWFGANHPIYDITFQNLDEAEHMRNFKKISADLLVYEAEYMDCLKSIPDEKYSQGRIDECLGPNYIKLMLDIKYETMRVISKADSRVKHFFLENCYKPAGRNEEYAKACDLFENDVLDLMWNGFDFVKLIELNRRKYTYDYATLNIITFKTILSLLEPIQHEFFELLNEIYAHKEVTFSRIKTLIDDRTKVIIAEAKRNPTLIQPKIISHNIEIEETVDGPDFDYYKNLPKQQIGGQDPSKYSVDLNNAFDRKLTDKANKDIANDRRLLNHGEAYHGLNAYSKPPSVNRYEIVKRTNRSLGGVPSFKQTVGGLTDVNVHGGSFLKQALTKRGYK